MEQKAMTKKEVMKLRPGTWIEVKWKDHPNTVALLIEKPVYAPGDVSFKCIVFDEKGSCFQYVGHDQVIRVLGKVEPPPLDLGLKA
jgi:hypothetical protein